MRESVQFFVEGTPKGQPRVRATIRGKHAGVYDPGTADDWKDAVRNAWVRTGAEMFTTPLHVAMRFYFQRPESHFTSKGALKKSAPFHHTSKPDIDNLFKSSGDALNGLGWTDDKLICYTSIWRQWVENGSSGCLITIREAEGGMV